MKKRQKKETNPVLLCADEAAKMLVKLFKKHKLDGHAGLIVLGIIGRSLLDAVRMVDKGGKHITKAE